MSPLESLAEAPVHERNTPAEDPSMDSSRRGVALLVDDEEAVRLLLTDVLELQGWQVISAGSGERALELLDDRVGLVVADLYLPGMGGRELVDRIRACLPLVPALILSGDLRETAAGEGVGTAFLAKPFQLSELQEAIERILV